MVSTLETFDGDIFELISTYHRSMVGYVYYLLKGKTTGDLYIQMVNLDSGDIIGPQFVGPTKNDASNPIDTNNDESYDLSNTTFNFEDHEKNRRLERGTVVIIGQSNTPDRDTYRYICTRMGGPWIRQRVIREVN